MTPEISIVLSTYNRASLVGGALQALIAQDTDVTYEIVLVDNNSTDGTRAIVEGMAPAARGRLRYVFEPRQGLSHGRNAGIAAVRGPLIAFTDDDVRAAPDWIDRLASVFRDHPEASFAGGRVLPVSTAGWPGWLSTRAAPLALQDYGGADRVLTRAHMPHGLVGANLAFRRTVFDRAGLFSPDRREFRVQARGLPCGPMCRPPD